MANVITEETPSRTPTPDLLRVVLEQLQAKGLTVERDVPALGELSLRIAALERDRQLLERLASSADTLQLISAIGEPVRVWKRHGAGPNVSSLRLREWLNQLPKVAR